jgi:DNA polymerase-3 subunit delta
MRLRGTEDLARRVGEQPPPVAVVHSNAALLREEAAEAARAALQELDPEAERLPFWADDQLDLEAVRQAAEAPSLFAQRRLVELHLGDEPLKGETAKWLQAYTEAPSAEAVVLVTCGYINKSAQGTAWFQAVDAAGVHLPLFAPSPEELPQWLRGRLRARGLEADEAAVAALADRVEGNLEAAAREVEKLALYLGGPGRVDRDTVAAAVGENPRYSVFDLAESAVAGRPERVARSLAVLRAEGAEVLALIGALAKEVRTLVALQARLRQGQPPEQAARAKDLNILPQRQKAAVAAARRLEERTAARALHALAAADRRAKGQADGDPWAAVEEAALGLAGASLPLPETEQE